MMFKIISTILLILLGIAFVIVIVATIRIISGKAKYSALDEKSPKTKIQENVSAVLRNLETGKKTVIRKRTLWEKLTGRA